MKRPSAIRVWYGLGLVLGAQLLLLGCGGGGKATASSGDSPTRTPSNFDFGQNDPLRVTAFGDSITLGVLGDRADGTILTTSNNYPNNLQLALRGLDPAWRVVNRGQGGERTFEGRGRLPGALGRDRPGFVLIMEGTNDADEGDDPSVIVANLEAMVDQAKANRSIPILGTIPPNFRNDPRAQGIIGVANRMIRTSARARGVVLAEIFNGMNDRSLFGSPERGIEDPLHPNERGYARMAGIWFAAMQQAIPAAPSTAQPPTAPPPSAGSSEMGQRARRR